MSFNTIVLITGANRGIGKGLVAAYLNQRDTTVIAAVRKTSSAKLLHALPKSSSSRLVVIEIDVASVKAIERGIASLATEHNIKSLDLVLANAGNANFSPKIAASEKSDIQPFIDSNAFGQLELYKAVAPLLRNSSDKGKPKFMYMSSVAGSLTAMDTTMDMSAYGASKALGNFLFRWLSFEQQDIIVWAQHPGVVATEIAKEAFGPLKAQGIDLESVAVPVEQCAQDILQIVENTTLENRHGKFIGPGGMELPW